MSAYEMGALFGAALGIGVGVLLFYFSRRIQGSLKRRGLQLLGAIFVLGCCANGVKVLRPQSDAQTTQLFHQGCVQSCRQQPAVPEDKCDALCECELAELSKDRSHRATIEWMNAHTQNGRADTELSQAIIASAGICMERIEDQGRP